MKRIDCWLGGFNNLNVTCIIRRIYKLLLFGLILQLNQFASQSNRKCANVCKFCLLIYIKQAQHQCQLFRVVFSKPEAGKLSQSKWYKTLTVNVTKANAAFTLINLLAFAYSKQTNCIRDVNLSLVRVIPSLKVDTRAKGVSKLYPENILCSACN